MFLLTDGVCFMYSHSAYILCQLFVTTFKELVLHSLQNFTPYQRILENAMGFHGAA